VELNLYPLPRYWYTHNSK